MQKLDFNKEEVARIEMLKKIEAIRKHCEELMRLVQAFVKAVNKD